MSQGSAVLDASGAIRILTTEMANTSILQEFILVRSPSIYWFEIGNICWKNITFGLWSQEQALNFLELSGELTILEQIGTQQEVLSLALKKKLSFYDASYLSMAIQTSSTLISFDKKLNQVAKDLGIQTLF